MTEVIFLGGGWAGVSAALEFKARKPAIEKLASNRGSIKPKGGSETY